MAHGRKTGGRKKGTPNKINAETQAAIAATGETPLDYMLRVMRDSATEDDRRDRMAVAAAPFVHSRLQATTLHGEAEAPLVTEITHIIVSPGDKRASDAEPFDTVSTAPTAREGIPRVRLPQ